MSLAERIFRRIFLAVTWCPLLTVAAAVVLSAVSIVYTVRHLQFQTGQMDLISPENRLVRLSGQIEHFDDLDTLIVAIENQDTGRSIHFLRALTSHLQQDREHYREVFCEVDPTPLKPWALLYLKKKDLFTLRDRLEEHRDFIQSLAQSPTLLTFFQQINEEIASNMVGELFTGFLSDDTGDKKEPLDLGFLIRVLQEMHQALDGPTSFTSPWSAFFGKSWSENSEERYFWTENKRYLLCFVTPAKLENSFTEAQPALEALRRAIAEIRKDFPEVNVGVTGQEALNVDEMALAFHDISIATLLSLIGLLLLLVLFWRGFRRPILETTELLFSLTFTFGFTTWSIGHLNILSVSFAPLLLGLGIDYGIHWFSRYQEEMQARLEDEKGALEATMVKLGPAIFLAGLTAALSFFPLVFSGFKGLSELGLITSAGLLIATLCTLFILPALTVLFDRPSKRDVLLVSAPNQPKSFLNLTPRQARLVMIFGAIVLIASLLGAKNVRFDLNMLKLQSKTAESVIWEKKLLADSQRSSKYGAVLAHSLEEVHVKSKALAALPTVSEVQSIGTLLPDDQAEKLSVLRTMRALVPESELLQNSPHTLDLAALETVLKRIRFKMLDSSDDQWGITKPLKSQMIQVRNLIDGLLQRFYTGQGSSHTMDNLQQFEDTLVQDFNDKLHILHLNVTNPVLLTIDDVPQPVRERFVDSNGLFLIRVYPSQNIWEPKFLEKFVSNLRSVDSDAIGDPVTLYVFTRAFRDGCIRAAAYAVLFVCALLLVTFQSWAYTMMALMPLILGTVWTLALVGLFGVNLNLANTIFLPLIVGAGVEYGIIIIQRYRQSGTSAGGTILPVSTARGIILAGLTTTVGFGSLTISAHQGIHSLGLLAAVGSLCIVAAAVFFLPPLLQLWDVHLHKRAGG